MRRELREFIIACAVLITFGAGLLHIAPVCAFLLRLLRTVRPLLFGILFATMLEPSYERLRTDFSAAAARRRITRTSWIRPVSLIGAMLPPVLILISIICVLIPQVTDSVRRISENISFYSDNLREWLARYSETRFARWLPPAQLDLWLDALPEKLPQLLRKTYDHTASFIRLLLDLCIGAVFSLYLLADKPRLRAQLTALFEQHKAQAKTVHLLHRGRMVCGLFARFLSSQVKESLILGGLCWCGMLLFHFPYPVLISAVIGITNIVPYLGPLAGTIPCVLLLLMIKPQAVLWFLLFIVILQQLESNLIYPRVVGHSIGLPPSWVLAAIVIGGGMFGMGGLLLGVPLAAVLYAALFPQDEETMQTNEDSMKKH